MKWIAGAGFLVVCWFGSPLMGAVWFDLLDNGDMKADIVVVVVDGDDADANGPLVAVCAKAGIGRKVGHKKACIRRKFAIKLPQRRKSLTVQGDCGKVIDIERAELCFVKA